MKERIIQFLSENNLTSTKFADFIGVQRSSISHILSGRNKPSFDFIEKMLLSYPDINAQWLITGKGNMFTNQQSLFGSDNKITDSTTSRESNIQESLNIGAQKSNSDKEIELVNENVIKKAPNGSNIERVIIFYGGGSFKEYKPS